MRHQCLEVLVRGLEAGQFRPGALRVVFAGGEVPDFLDFLAAFGVQPVEPAFALASAIALFDHAAQAVPAFFRRIELAERVVRGERRRRCDRGRGMQHQVDADPVEEPEDARFGKAGRRAHRRVGLLDRNALPHGFFQPAHHPVAADAVGDEARCILALQHGLAERQVGEAANVVGCARGACCRSGRLRAIA